MKWKNNATDKRMEKLPTFISSIVTKARMIRASLKNYLRENSRDVFLALVLLASLFLVPILFCVTASAEEVAPALTPTSETNDFPDYVIPDGDYPYLPFEPSYPTVLVQTGVGSYSTPSTPNSVFAYLTSYRNPKASTRSSTLVASMDAVRSRTFVFKNADNPSATQNMRYSVDCLHYVPIVYDYADDLILDPRLNLRFQPSADTSFTVRCTVTKSFDLNPTVFVQEWTQSVTAGGWFNFNEIPYLLEFYLSADPHYRDMILTNVEVIVNPLDFDNVSPDTSYIDVYAIQTNSIDYNSYLQSISRFLCLYEVHLDEAYDYGLDLGEAYGREQGYNEGYDVGYDEGYGEGLIIGESHNFEPGWFVRGIDALFGIRLFEYSFLNEIHEFTLGTVFLISIGGTALLWFLKLFVGG